MLDRRLADKPTVTIHKLHTLVMQNMPTIGKYRDMSRIYIALQGKCKTDLIRKVTNFNEKNACRLVYTEHD